MTERFEPTNGLQRALVNDPATFGEIVPGTAEEPAVYMESVHFLKKIVAGAPNIRPPWFFDTAEQGEGFNDIGTHPRGPDAVDPVSRAGDGLSPRRPRPLGAAGPTSIAGRISGASRTSRSRRPSPPR
jgi:hypothetical protein